LGGSFAPHLQIKLKTHGSNLNSIFVIMSELKLMKIRWPSLFWGSFAPHFQIKLKTHSSNLNSIFVIMIELKFFLLIRVLIQNFNTVDLVKFLENNKKTSHLDRRWDI
jgi:hypothetical protein